MKKNIEGIAHLIVIIVIVLIIIVGLLSFMVFKPTNGERSSLTDSLKSFIGQEASPTPTMTSEKTLDVELEEIQLEDPEADFSSIDTDLSQL